MTTARQLQEHVGLNRALRLAGLSKSAWYYVPKERDIPVDPAVSDMVQKIGQKRHTYGTRRMAAMLSRTMNRPVNRKQVQRIYRRLGWIEPQKAKREIMRSQRDRPRPTAPNQLWQTDMTYVWCGMGATALT